MDRFDRVIKVMVVSGLLTCTLLLAAFSPEAALRSSFGETLSGPLADTIVRNWGVLVAMTGGFLIYGAYVPACRLPALVMATVGKATFVSLVLGQGDRYMPQAMFPVVLDSALVVVYVAYVALSVRRQAAGSTSG
jgi:hypothetical protein